jgi:hypothetical protein
MVDEVFKLKLQIEFMNRGLVPLGMLCGGAPIHFDINKLISELSPAEARAMRRKFRKEWRRIVKQKVRRGGKEGKSTAHMLGFGLDEPKRKHKESRKQKVYHELSRKLLQE